MKRFMLFAIWVVFLFLLVACSSKGNEAQDNNRSSETMESSQSEQFTIEKNVMEDAAVEGGDEQQTIAEIKTTEEQKIIYTAHMQIEVSDYAAAKKEIETLVEESGGYIVSSNVYQVEDNERNGTVTVRIPQASFNVFLDKAAMIASKVIDQSVNSEDVTEEYVDLEARLKAKQAVKTRLESFMEEAETTKDLLDVSNELAKVQEELEQIQGRINYLKNRSDYATVTISMKERSLKAGEIDGNDLNTWARAKQLFVNTVNALITGISGIAVILIGLSPIILPLAAVTGGFVYVRWKKKKTNREAGRE